MAVKKLGQLCGQVRSKWPDVHYVAVHHRVGVVGPAEASVVVAVTRYPQYLHVTLVSCKLFNSAQVQA